MAKALLPSQSTMTKVADPAGAKAWLDSVVTSKSDAFEEFLSGVGYVNLDEEFLNIRFPYLPPVANDSLVGIAPMYLLAASKDDVAAFRFIRKVIAYRLVSGEPIPQEWHNLHVGIVAGTMTEPKKKGRPKLHERRDELLRIVAHYLQEIFEVDLLADEDNLRGDSAIEIMSSALAKICPGLNAITLKGIEQAIVRRKRALSYA